MSANWDERLGSIYLSKERSQDQALLASIEMEFDTSADIDNHNIIKFKAREQLARKTCIMKTITFPVELIASLAIFGMKDASKRLRLQRDMFKYLFKRGISLDELVASIVNNS